MFYIYSFKNFLTNNGIIPSNPTTSNAVILSVLSINGCKFTLFELIYQIFQELLSEKFICLSKNFWCFEEINVILQGKIFINSFKQKTIHTNENQVNNSIYINYAAIFVFGTIRYILHQYGT